MAVPWLIARGSLRRMYCIKTSAHHALGYEPQEQLSNDELIKEAYKGIRLPPATQPARTLTPEKSPV
jgi:hypothetical protein